MLLWPQDLTLLKHKHSEFFRIFIMSVFPPLLQAASVACARSANTSLYCGWWGVCFGSSGRCVICMSQWDVEMQIHFHKALARNWLMWPNRRLDLKKVLLCDSCYSKLKVFKNTWEWWLSFLCNRRFILHLSSISALILFPLITQSQEVYPHVSHYVNNGLLFFSL